MTTYITPSDDWVSMLEAAAPAEHFIFADGQYSESEYVSIRQDVTIEAENRGQAEIEAAFSIGVSSGPVWFVGMDLKHPATDQQLLFVDCGIVKLRNCDVNGSQALAGARFMFLHGAPCMGYIQGDSSGFNINYDGSGVNTQLISVGNGAGFRCLASTDGYVQIRMDNAGEIIEVDSSNVYIANTIIKGGGKTGNVDGIAIRRGGEGRVTRSSSIGCGVYDCRVGVRAQHGGECFLSAGYGSLAICNNNIGLTPVSGGYVSYDTNSVHFLGNNQNTQQNGANIVRLD